MTAATRGTTHRAKTMGLGVLLGLATLTKFAPAATLPALWRRYGWVPVMAFAAVCLGLYVPFLDVGVEQVTAGLRTYSEHWTANDGLFWILRSVIQDPLVARFLAAGVVGGVVVLTVARRMTVDDALLWTLGAGILLSPTVHPWYTLWLLPFAALRTHPAFLTLTATAFLGYWGLTEFQETGAWPLPWGARLMMWGPVWSLLLWGAWQGRRRNRAGEAKEP